MDEIYKRIIKKTEAQRDKDPKLQPRASELLEVKDEWAIAKLEDLAKEFDYAAWKGFGQNESEFEKGYKLAMEIAARRLREK